MARYGVIAAVQRHDTPVIFDWLIEALSYQGVSDSIAFGYMEQHGRVRWHYVADALGESPSCPKLTCYWAFAGCGYRKALGSCANPDHQPGCPLPRHDLRNGRLNQTAYSLFLFMRDLADSDIVSWIDGRLAGVDPAPATNRADRLRQALLEPLGHVYGVSNKVLAMALSQLLLAGDAKRPAWIEAGAVMIAVDTLVHNFLHRTGILRDLGAEHLYGARCYGPNGCAVIIERIASQIDARRFNPAFPANFPRFVRHAIWRFCAEAGSTAAMAAASTIARRVCKPIARCSQAVRACRLGRRKRATVHAKREFSRIHTKICCMAVMFLLCSRCRAVRSPVARLTATLLTLGLQMSEKVPIIVVLGIDIDGKPHASRFEDRDAPFVVRAAELMAFHVIQVPPANAELHAIAEGLPVGKIYATGRAFVPFVGRAAFDKLAELAEGGVTIEQRAASGAEPVLPRADMFTTEAINTADALWSKIEVGTVVLAAQPELYEGWWEGVVVDVKGDDLTVRWMDEPGEDPIRVARRHVALRHPVAD